LSKHLTASSRTAHFMIYTIRPILFEISRSMKFSNFLHILYIEFHEGTLPYPERVIDGTDRTTYREYGMNLSGAVLCNFRSYGVMHYPLFLVVLHRSSRRVDILETCSLHIRLPLTYASRERRSRKPVEADWHESRPSSSSYLTVIGCTKRNMHADICGTRFDSARGYNNVAKILSEKLARILLFIFNMCAFEFS